MKEMKPNELGAEGFYDYSTVAVACHVICINMRVVFNFNTSESFFF